MPQLRLALAQINPIVGDIDHNLELIVSQCVSAAAAGAHVVTTGEMAIVGYPIEDLSHRQAFITASRNAVQTLAKRLEAADLGDLVVVVGYLDQADETADDGHVYPRNNPTNSVAVIQHGTILGRYDKHHLPNYGVFDEFRHFVPGDRSLVVHVNDVPIAIAVCEDIWQDGPAAAARAAQAQVLLVLNGSPYEAAKDDVRLALCQRRAREANAHLAYVNLVGGQDELVFDGDSLIVDAAGQLLARAPQFAEHLLITDLDVSPNTDAPEIPSVSRLYLRSTPNVSPALDTTTLISERLDDFAERYGAIVLGLHDYVEKNGFTSVLFGMSGGIDSTLVAALAVDALGPDRVFGVSNPSAWSTEHSRSDAQDQAERMGINLRTIPIAPIFDAFQESLSLTGVAEENLQARIRAVIWMGLSNQENRLVLACGNKSELATGYSTIYGDAVGGYAPIKDLPKTLVWELSRWRNRLAESRGETPPIPPAVIDKPPSAELRPGQLDSDSLPPYDILDGIIDAYVERDLSVAETIAEGFDADLVHRVAELVDRAEYKRRQYPPGPKLSKRNFGRDRRVPITHRWRDEN
ncbi:MAG: NAD+ synthase [Aeromicrobium sp.]|nr:MAG: NAD+ synthase [Aeromicrobium sp.]